MLSSNSSYDALKAAVYGILMIKSDVLALGATMPPANPTDKLLTAPIEDLVGLLFKQFQRLFLRFDLDLTARDIQHLSGQISQRGLSREAKPALYESLHTLIQESLVTLNERWHLTFLQALKTDMSGITGWETTAEFIDIANEKSNAELRISAGATLLTFMGDYTFIDHLFDVISADDGHMDVDAALARRALMFAAEINEGAEDWLQQVRSWREHQLA